MNSFPPAVRRFGYAAAEARASRARRAVRVAPEAMPDATPRPTRVRLWLPLTPLFILLAPFALTLSLLGYLVPPRLRPDPIQAALAIGAVLLSLGGTQVLVDCVDAKVRIHIL
jgi:hypothetical protein